MHVAPTLLIRVSSFESVLLFKPKHRGPSFTMLRNPIHQTECSFRISRQCQRLWRMLVFWNTFGMKATKTLSCAVAHKRVRVA